MQYADMQVHQALRLLVGPDKAWSQHPRLQQLMRSVRCALMFANAGRQTGLED